ncbi:methylated-DNA--[protein]-cysteine S-methyltransferase [Desulfonatronovibrio hydrogenovorans]|uniref:methylated-DNA--[protein]-cysteine S-methyltransferase n=1 Tax=Desulfonatronovibrio hydrogenovorans TaxID=53245 RepID=UPI00068C9C7A|nr:MGMT family protein [Desulfonatronovibrio hydrogenovorans]
MLDSVSSKNNEKKTRIDLEDEYFANRYFSLTVAWRDDLIHHISLGPGQVGHVSSKSRPYSRIINQAMVLYEKKTVFSWPDPPLDWSIITSTFHKKVLTTLVEQVGFGQTISYGKLAALSGSPRAARAVGRAMATNPWPLIIPCHRVLTARKTIGGFSSGTEIKTALLGLEGWFFSESVAKRL